jgi:hypothetical protein
VATDDVQRLVTGTAPAPAHFVVPGNGQIRPKTVFATYDGTGAAGSFKPALKVISDGGETVGVYATDDTVAAGASADVSWFPGVTATPGIPPLPGQILSIYGGHNPAVDFTTNSAVFIQTNFPTNTTFNKVSSTSVLQILGEFDFTSGAAPDTLFLGVFIDGANSETTGIDISQAGTFCTAVIATIKGVPGTGQPPYAAGAHTVDVRVACIAGVNFTLRTSTSVDLTITEYEA